MAKRSGPPTPFEPLAELGWKYSAERKRALDEWNRRRGDRPPPTKREQRNVCKFLLDNPFLLKEPYGQYILPILQSWLAKTDPSKRPYSGKEIAGFADFVIDTETPHNKARAYQKVAEALRMTADAVKQNHVRHGKSKRDKSR
jgi:hypothetical protein